MNKLAPRVVTVTDEATVLSSNHKRVEAKFYNSDAANDIGLTTDSTETDYDGTNGYPLKSETEFTDISAGIVYGVAANGQTVDIVVWETEG